MSWLKFALLTVVVVGLSIVASCNDKDRDEQQASSAKPAASQATAQKPSQKPDADEDEEGEEGPATPAAVAQEKPAPQQPAGKQLVYDFDTDTPGQVPAKFHTAKTGRGAPAKWSVTAEPTAPS